MREIAGARLACALALWLLASSAGGGLLLRHTGMSQVSH